MVSANISQLKSHANFKKYLQRSVKCGEVHAAKLIKHLYEDLVNEPFGVDINETTWIVARQYFQDRVGFAEWVQYLFVAGVIERLRAKRCSQYKLGRKGQAYLQKIFEESQNQSERLLL